MQGIGWLTASCGGNSWGILPRPVMACWAKRFALLAGWWLSYWFALTGGAVLAGGASPRPLGSYGSPAS